MTGHYRMARGWQNHDAFEGDPYSRRDAWVWMIERAAWKATRHRIEGKFVAIERGQFAASLRAMAEAWGWGHERVRRFLRLLASDAMIETATETGKFVVTICNYSKYQATSSENETSTETRTRRQRDSNETLKKEGKEGKEEERDDANASSGTQTPAEAFDGRSSKRGKRLPTDWQPNVEDCEFATSLGLGIGLGDVAAEFRDYWIAVPGAKGCKLDWSATFRNRCRDVANNRGRINGRSPRRQSAVENLMEGFARAAGVGRPPGGEPDWETSGPLLDGEYTRFDA